MDVLVILNSYSFGILVTRSIPIIHLRNIKSISCNVVNNGLEALKTLEKEDYDLIIMDCQMPVMDDYISKPFIWADIRPVIKKYLIPDCLENLP